MSGCTLAAVGDICAGTGCSQGRRTAATIRAISPHRVIGLGDYQYNDGRASAWGRGFGSAFADLAPITLPVFGATHDTSDGSGSWEGNPRAFFNAQGGKGFGGYRGGANLGARGNLSDHQPGYSVKLGTWHAVFLNYKAGDAAVSWLRRDLAAHPSRCLLAVDHAPFVGSPSGEHPRNEGAIFNSVLQDGGVDLMLNAHNHFYERNTVGGATAITSGTGGVGHYQRTRTADTARAYNASTYGVTRVRLEDGRWNTRFVPNQGAAAFSDTASGRC